MRFEYVCFQPAVVGGLEGAEFASEWFMVSVVGLHMAIQTWCGREKRENGKTEKCRSVFLLLSTRHPTSMLLKVLLFTFYWWCSPLKWARAKRKRELKKEITRFSEQRDMGSGNTYDRSLFSFLQTLIIKRGSPKEIKRYNKVGKLMLSAVNENAYLAYFLKRMGEIKHLSRCFLFKF